MEILDKLKLNLNKDAKDFIDLFRLLDKHVENILPRHILNRLDAFIKLCYEEPDDPIRQIADIEKHVLELKELIPGYRDVALMLFPHEDSRAYQYRKKKEFFETKLNYFIDTETIDKTSRNETRNILATHDYSLGTPPTTQSHLDLMFKIVIGDHVTELRKFKGILGIKENIEEAQWNYLMDVLEQMIVQSSHYTLESEKRDFLSRTKLTTNFKGLTGFIRTVVGGSSDTVVTLLTTEVFKPNYCAIIDYKDSDSLFDTIQNSDHGVFIVKLKHMRKNIFNDEKWFPWLSRLILVDDSPISRSTNTSLVFSFHNQIINNLNKVHNKILGALANSQLNLRLILDKISADHLEKFRAAAEKKVQEYKLELDDIKHEQLGAKHSYKKDLQLYKFNDFAKQIIKDKYIIQKFHDYIVLLQATLNEKKLKKQNDNLIQEFERRTKAYFYSNIDQVKIATIVEGGGRSQLRTYGNYLLQRKLKPLPPKIIAKCNTIINIIPDNYKRTLKNHFHKNFGINLILEKYKEFITKAENKADNKGRFTNLLIDLGIKEDYDNKSSEEQTVIKEFLSNLANLEITSIADDVQMVIRDILLKQFQNPYILFNQEASWEYRDIFPVDRFDINAFDLEIGLTEDKKIDFERLYHRLNRMKSTFQLFDDTAQLWDSFCENLTIIINDPSNPSGYTDFNDPSLIKLLKFLNNNKITLLLDEAYNDAIKIDDPDEPKWRTISRYIMNNISSLQNISVVSSLSTTKNLGATGSRLGSLIATPARNDVIEYAKKQNPTEKANTNSLYMLVNVLENAQLAKKIKDRMEAELSKEASRTKIKNRIEKYIVDEIESFRTKRKNKTKDKTTARFSPFEGSPLHIFLLDELTSLDKLEILELPDDFKYKGEPFFKYYRDHLVKDINTFRINKNFRTEANRRLELAKEIANEFLNDDLKKYVEILPSDGSYLFNLQLKNFFSFQDLEKFTKKLAEQRGIGVIPYQTGFLRFALGDYISGSAESYDIFKKELLNTFQIIFKYWIPFHQKMSQSDTKAIISDEILDSIFETHSDRDFINQVLEDFDVIKKIKKETLNTLTINHKADLYLPFPQVSGVSINTIERSQNSVFEFYENIASCKDVLSFIQSLAFTKIYENLLSQIYTRIPAMKNLDFYTVNARYGKATLLKYISSKLSFQPNHYNLDLPDDLNIMKEILLEIEAILFSDAKVKIMAFNASSKGDTDRLKLEGANQILRKYIYEILIHFNLPFDHESIEPNLEELNNSTAEIFTEVTGIKLSTFNLDTVANDFILSLKKSLIHIPLTNKTLGFLETIIRENILNANLNESQKILIFYLLSQENSFTEQIGQLISTHHSALENQTDMEIQALNEHHFFKVFNDRVLSIGNEIFARKNIKISSGNLSDSVRSLVLYYVNIINNTKSNEYYDKYIHTLIRFIKVKYQKQNSRRNEMIQHGISLHKDFKFDKTQLEKYTNYSLNWMPELMSRCGVIASEQAVQRHTRIKTDAKKREYPFHKVDRSENKIIDINQELDNNFIKTLDIKPVSAFFGKRLEKFIRDINPDDYRCKISTRGFIRVLYVFQKSYLKYLTDQYRLLEAEEISLTDVQDFYPDVLLVYGAPEKVLSFPQIGYFDLPGINGNIKTLITPLKAEVDYFGDIKKPWLTMMNEKIKDIGGVPVHGSLFAVEGEDGSIFVVQIDGDSGVGKSEMLAAMILKWLRKDLTGVRSIKLIAGDMFFVFPDTKGNLYGVGTEQGDFSRVTDFDPDFIRHYHSLFESAADSNSDDLNSRSTISGLCDVSMPFKIDIMLSASNYAREEAGITRFDNPENFLLFRDSHGERKEKATSSDNPHFQRTLLRYTSDKNIVDVMDKHGNYLDDILDWEKDEKTGSYYLCSSFKMLDKIDIEDTVNKIFKGKTCTFNSQNCLIKEIHFDIIQNRFIATVQIEESESLAEYAIDRDIFSSIFNSLASTPSGQPFVAEEGQYEAKRHLIKLLNTSPQRQKIQFGILSTDLGREGKEISGPQMAAEDLKKMIQEARLSNPAIIKNKRFIHTLIREKYAHIFAMTDHSSEVLRYNFFLYQLEEMKKARFVRIDDPQHQIDLSHVKGFQQIPEDKNFSPLLVTPNINFELDSFNEAYEQILGFPDTKNISGDYENDLNKLYIAQGYSTNTIINNCIVQLLLMNNNLIIEDIARGQIIEKVNRETLAAAKFAVVGYLSSLSAK